jgi:hypothetical protein
MSVVRRLRSVGTLVLLLALAVASSSGAKGKPSRAPGSDRAPPPVVVSVRDSGFHWADAGVGAAAMLAVTLLAVGLAIALRSERRTTTSRQALSLAQKEDS